MLKKVITSALLFSVGMTSAYAELITITGNNSKTTSSVRYWKIKGGHQSYGLTNGDSTPIKARIFVNEDIFVKKEGTYKADKVNLTCNGVMQYLTPGTWQECELKSDGGELYITVADQDYHHGADGVYEW